jgi:hypothetical protein
MLIRVLGGSEGAPQPAPTRSPGEETSIASSFPNQRSKAETRVGGHCVLVADAELAVGSVGGVGEPLRMRLARRARPFARSQPPINSVHDVHGRDIQHY